MAQKTDEQLHDEKDVIKNETAKEANTALRNGIMLEDIIDSKINNDQKGIAGGIPELDEDGQIPEDQIPDAIANVDGGRADSIYNTIPGVDGGTA